MQISEVDSAGNSTEINIDSIINVPQKTFDSLVLSQLYVPQDIEMVSRCYMCSATTVVSFECYNYQLIETKIVRGFDKVMDSMLLIQQKKIYDLIVRNSNFKKDKTYCIVIALRFEQVDEDDKISIRNYGNLGGRDYVLQKSKNCFRYKSNSIDSTLIPRDIEECMVQLDSILTDETKRNIKIWDKQFYDYKTHYTYSNWINNIWNINCGFTVHPIQEKYGLEKYFEDLGITESCYITRIILDCYYQHLNAGTINFDEEIAKYKDKMK